MPSWTIAIFGSGAFVAPPSLFGDECGDWTSNEPEEGRRRLEGGGDDRSVDASGSVDAWSRFRRGCPVRNAFVDWWSPLCLLVVRSFVRIHTGSLGVLTRNFTRAVLNDLALRRVKRTKETDGFGMAQQAVERKTADAWLQCIQGLSGFMKDQDSLV